MVPAHLWRPVQRIRFSFKRLPLRNDFCTSTWTRRRWKEVKGVSPPFRISSNIPNTSSQNATFIHSNTHIAYIPVLTTRDGVRAKTDDSASEWKFGKRFCFIFDFVSTRTNSCLMSHGEHFETAGVVLRQKGSSVRLDSTHIWLMHSDAFSRLGVRSAEYCMKYLWAEFSSIERKLSHFRQEDKCEWL